MDPERFCADFAGSLDAAPDESLADSGAAPTGSHRERAKSGPAGGEVAPAFEADVRVERDRPHDASVVLGDEHLGLLEPRTHVDELGEVRVEDPVLHATSVGGERRGEEARDLVQLAVPRGPDPRGVEVRALRRPDLDPLLMRCEACHRAAGA